MKPQVNEQNGSTQNGDIATDAASVAMDAAAIVPTAATAAAASVGAVVPAKSGLQLKLEMLNLGNGNGEFAVCVTHCYKGLCIAAHFLHM